MRLIVLKEDPAQETRVAATPDSVKRLRALGFSIGIESGAGLAAGASDQAYRSAGAEIITGLGAAADADVVLKVRRPGLPGEWRDELTPLKRGCILIGLLAPRSSRPALEAYAHAGITALAMELVPRITRAQSMDVLSSQANLAGYKAVLDGLNEFPRAVPMMITAAGTIAPARVFVLGAGVAGLQAIATARRLGAVVSATDVRPVARQQVESLGATFVYVDDEEARQAQTAGGYAKAMSADYQRKQDALIAETVKKQDLVICTALIPGRTAPRLLSAMMVATMRPGSVIVDLAVESGGNCELAQAGAVVDVGGVRIVGHRNVPGRLAVDASALYARNLSALAALLVDAKTQRLVAASSDEIITAVTLTRDGAIVHPEYVTATAP